MTILKIYIDFKSPESYLAFHQTRKISFGDNIRIEWRPFLTNSRNIPIAKEIETKGETHARIREEHRKFINLKYSKNLSIPMRYPDEDIQTNLALALTPHLQDKTVQYISLAFDYYWRKNWNLNDPAIVEMLLAKTQSDKNLLRNSSALIDTLRENTALSKEQGVLSTPTYQINEELFLGREHLPWIEKILNDQS